MAPRLESGRFLRFAVRMGEVMLMIASLCAICAHAKDAPLTAIELYDGKAGAGYVQITGVLFNGKSELRVCGSSPKIDKSAYGKLSKVTLAGAASLERRTDGMMMLTKNSVSACVVPSNLKIEKNTALRPSELADLATIQGQVLASSPNGVGTPPPLKPGVQLVFVSAPDTELAEYLRAERSQSITFWQDYLSRYSSSGHVIAARQALATLFVKQTQESLATYRKSVAVRPSYSDLKSARVSADKALELTNTEAEAKKVRGEVRVELVALADRLRTEFQAYQQALQAHAPGYIHLGNARQLGDQILEVDANFEPAQALKASINNEFRAFDRSLQNAQSLATAQRFDDAVATLAPYSSFVDEEPRIAAVMNAGCKFHFDRGRDAETAGKWQPAVQEYTRAAEICKTPEIAAALPRAHAGLNAFTNRSAADEALRKSQSFEEQHQYVEAYEILAGLTNAQQALVADRMQSLEPFYVKSASDKANELQQAHTPIQGRMDEIGMQRAFGYLQRASNLSPDNQDLKLRLDLLEDAISDYYVAQAKKFEEKPLGSGAGLAWLYLDQAQMYRPNREDVRDERTKSTATHQLRSKLSIRVVFRDQTSRRDSPAFAEQLSDSIATGLETSGLPVRVIRASDPTPVEPNFQLIGDVLQHRPVVNPSVQAMESKYRAGEREIPNDDWNKANREYEAATLDFQDAQKALEAVQAKGKRKEIAELNDAVILAQKKVEACHEKLDAIPKTVPTDIIKPYTYIKKTSELEAVLELAFRIVDSDGNIIGSPTPITRDAHKTYVVLENVKPEDTEGVKTEGSPPDPIQFLADVEIDARDTLIKAARQQVEALPEKIFELAHRRAAEGDLDSAAESYILYLNSTPDSATARRGEATRFLQEQFNMRQVSNHDSVDSPAQVAFK